MSQEGVPSDKHDPPSRLLNAICLLSPLVSFATVYQSSYYSPAIFALIVPYGLLTVIAYAVSMMFNSPQLSRAAFMLFIGCIVVDIVCIGFTTLWYFLWTTPSIWTTK
jgi:hypothetical protein